MRTGHSAKRSLNVWKCCSARSVVGRHIGGHRLDRRRLVGRLLEVETRGEGLDIVRPDAEGMAMARGALGV